jgi:hypothetical protein
MRVPLSTFDWCAILDPYRVLRIFYHHTAGDMGTKLLLTSNAAKLLLFRGTEHL